MPERALVSAIVPVHNEASVLPRILDSIDLQTSPPEELILVFDRCTDRSEELAKGRAQVTVRSSAGNTAAAIRAGIDVASHEHLVLFDGNTLVPPDYVECLLRAEREEAADLVEWHGGLMSLRKSALDRYGPLSDLHLWTLEYMLRLEAHGGKIVRLHGPFFRLKPSPLPRNVRYGLEYADLSDRYGLASFFRIGRKSGWVQDTVATMGAILGHARRRRLRRAARSLLTELGRR